MRSVLAQEYLNLEYILIDGGSTDGSQEIIRQYEDRIALWCSEADSGHYEAVDKGFARSSGEIMTWLNADDIYIGRKFALSGGSKSRS
jgi:glycosyltransferase involved in cell wall biosynthesis